MPKSTSEVSEESSTAELFLSLHFNTGKHMTDKHIEHTTRLQVEVEERFNKPLEWRGKQR